MLLPQLRIRPAMRATLVHLFYLLHVKYPEINIESWHVVQVRVYRMSFPISDCILIDECFAFLAKSNRNFINYKTFTTAIVSIKYTSSLVSAVTTLEDSAAKNWNPIVGFSTNYPYLTAISKTKVNHLLRFWKITSASASQRWPQAAVPAKLWKKGRINTQWGYRTALSYFV